MSLQENRYNRERKKNRIRRHIKDTYDSPDLAYDPRYVGKMYSVHMRGCSCPICKHSRHNPLFHGKYKLTLQERRCEDAEDIVE